MLGDKNKYIGHIKDDEQIISMRKVLDKLEKVLKNHTTEYTDFLDPYQRRLCYSFLNTFNNIEYFEEGGHQEAERKAIIIYPSYKTKFDINNPIGAIEIKRSSKFSNPTHRDYLGAIMALGIKREKIGDILIHENFAQIILHMDILPFIIYNLQSVGKETVKTRIIGLSEIIRDKEQYHEIDATVSSLRLDAVLSAALNLSRASSTNYIRNSRVKVNWQPITQPSFVVNEGDLMSVNGFGRLRLHSIIGTTRKGKIRVQIRKIK